jgi:uncharacterized protein (DUF2126 family)
MDFEDVIAEMRAAGYALRPAWFAPHLEFRFPMLGRCSRAGIELTLRNALEPWHVMGEEGAPGGTARYVDSSLERIEVHVTGMNESRYVVTCNGHALPLQNTGTVGEYVAGVRYKAWSPPSALHPSIGTHVPLVFDIVDTWMKRSVGGCQYHVAHPGGLSYESSRSMPTRPRAGACRASSPWATRRAPCTCHRPRSTWPAAGSFRSPWICATRP